jgi:hypothetical protein
VKVKAQCTGTFEMQKIVWFIALSSYIDDRERERQREREREGSEISSLMTHFKYLDKQEQAKPKVS